MLFHFFHDTYYTAAHIRKESAMTRRESSKPRFEPIVKKNWIKSAKWLDKRGASYNRNTVIHKGEYTFHQSNYQH